MKLKTKILKGFVGLAFAVGTMISVTSVNAGVPCEGECDTIGVGGGLGYVWCLVSCSGTCSPEGYCTPSKPPVMN